MRINYTRCENCGLELECEKGKRVGGCPQCGRDLHVRHTVLLEADQIEEARRWGSDVVRQALAARLGYYA